MKTCSEELKQFINNAKNLHMCDLYEFGLSNGMVLRYANYDKNVVTNGNTFLSKAPIFKRGNTKLKLGTSVDTMSVTIYSDRNDSVAEKTFLQAARIGAFDDGTMSLYQCYFDDTGAVVGTILIFKGEIEIKSGGGLTITMDVKSSMQRLDVDYPLRCYYVECPFSVYDSNCGVNINSFKAANHVAAGSTAINIVTAGGVSAGYYNNGGIIFTSGDLNGVTMPIKTNSGNVLTLMTELVGVPAVGDTFVIYPGCDKTNSCCASRFGNSRRNRSTPFVPLPETIYQY